MPVTDLIDSFVPPTDVVVPAQRGVPVLPANIEELEEWRGIAGFSGYEVSDFGRVRSVDRISVNRLGVTRRLRGRTLSTTNLDSRGYARVSLGFGHGRWVHRLVCAAFHGDAPWDDAVVRHLNGNEADNRAANLAWGTPLDNSLDVLAHGRHERANLVRCKRGHLLALPNIRPNMVGTRHRGCYACEKALGVQFNRRKYRNEEIDLQAEADAQYAKIMRGQPAL